MLDRAFSALASAWIVTFVATAVLFVALSAASIWDTAIFQSVAGCPHDGAFVEGDGRHPWPALRARSSSLAIGRG
jgi:hypothetical protein